MFACLYPMRSSTDAVSGPQIIHGLELNGSADAGRRHEPQIDSIPPVGVLQKAGALKREKSWYAIRSRRRWGSCGMDQLAWRQSNKHLPFTHIAQGKC